MVEVGGEICFCGDIGCGFSLFHSPLVFGGLDIAEVIYDGLPL